MSDSNQIEHFEYYLKPGYIIVNCDDTVVRTVLGNCVAVTIYDPVARFGGMNHFVFPEVGDADRATAKFGNIAVPALVNMLVDNGASRSALEAQIFGGASNGKFQDGGMGFRNVDIARRMLERLRVPVVSEDVGGLRGRKLIYNTGSNETVVYKVNSIRDSDWYLPGQDINDRAR